MPAAYEYRGTAQGVSFNTLTLDGTYSITGAMTDGPPGAEWGGFLRVQAYATYLIQTYTYFNDVRRSWRRIIRPANSTFGPWATVSHQFANKTIVCFGDSVTEFGDYPQRLAARTGAKVIKAGFGGCRMGAHSIPQYDPFSMYRLSERIANGSWGTLTTAANTLFAFNGDDNRPQTAALAGLNWSAVDYAILFWGANDHGGNVPLGSASDTTGATLSGAVNATIANILGAYPTMRLLFVTPLWSSRDGGSEVAQNGIGLLRKDYADVIMERASAFNVETYDLLRKCGMNLFNEGAYLSDGAHPTAPVGYQLLADKIGAALESRF